MFEDIIYTLCFRKGSKRKETHSKSIVPHYVPSQFMISSQNPFIQQLSRKEKD